MKRLRPLALALLLAPASNAAAGVASEGPPLTAAERESLLAVDTRGGEVLAVPRFDLSSSTAAWQNQPHMYWDFHEADDANPAFWFAVPEPPDTEAGPEWLSRGTWSERNVPLKPNRSYLLSTLIRADFDRVHAELNLGLQPMDAQANSFPGRREVGFPAHTEGPNGWQRFETVITTPPNAGIKLGRPTVYVYVGEGYERPVDLAFGIADLTLVELPETPLVASDDPVSMVTFPGGPGNLPMRVEPAERADDGTTTVTVTGVAWTIDPAAGTISADQQIDFQRPLASWKIDADLTGLTVKREDATVAVLGNDAVELGFQCDGMLAVYPKTKTAVTVTSKLAAPFVRYGDGHLLVSDGLGGFGVNAYPPIGSGKLPDTQPLTEGLDFAGFDRTDLESLSTAPAGWQIAWHLDPAERLFLYAMPPRPYDWEKSFSLIYQLTDRKWTREDYRSDLPQNADTFLLWDFHAREWGMSFGEHYLPVDEDAIREHVAWAHAEGKRAIFYTSAWFFGSRDARVWTDAVMEQIEKFGFDGFYSDGLPAVEWLVGYEEMRILRERLGDKLMIVHDSVPQSGRHPAAMTPWTYTYPDATYMAEHLKTDAGAAWPWVRYVINGHRAANSIGTIKGDGWEGPGFEEKMDKFKAGLIWNARRMEVAGHVFNTDYVPELRQLEALWKDHGDDAFFYDRYYVEKARELSGFRVGPAAMPIVEHDGDEVTLRSMTPDAVIHYTLDGSEPTAKSPVYEAPLRDATAVRAMAVAEGLDPSPPTPRPSP